MGYNIHNIIKYLENCIPGSSKNHSDVIITCSDGQLSAHKLVLASISQMLYSEFKQNNWDKNISLVFPEFSVRELSKYLFCVYNGKSLKQFSTLNKLFGCSDINEKMGFVSIVKSGELDVESNEEIETNEEIGINDQIETMYDLEMNEIDCKKPIVIPLKKRPNPSIKKKIGKEDHTNRQVLKHFDKAPDKLSCLYCTFEFQTNSSIQSLESHLKVAHTLDTMYDRRGRKCDKNYQEDESTLDPETGKLDEKSYVWNHFRKEGKGNKTFICSLCNSEFKFLHLRGYYLGVLKKHLLAAHEIELQFAEKYVKPEVITDKNGKTKIVKDMNREGFIWRFFKDHPDNPKLIKNKKFICQVCFKAVVQDCMVRHLLTHNIVENEPADCSICGKTFENFMRRDIHEKRHNLPKKFICQHCPKGFKTTQTLKNHLMTHTGEMPFQCNECGRRFNQRYQLTTHTRIHTGEMPYECDKCKKKFRFISTRNSHKCSML